MFFEPVRSSHSPVTRLGQYERVELQPLEGFVVGVTADRRWQEQAELLRRRGATVVHGPSITTLYLDSDENLRRVTMALIAKPPDYLVATTGIGIRAWFEAAQVWGMGDDLVDAMTDAKVVARGPKAAAAVSAVGLDVWHRSATERLDDVIAALEAEPLAGRRVAVQQYGMDSPELMVALEAADAQITEVPVYRWRVPDDPRPAERLIEAVCAGRVDAVTFTSAPAVHNLFSIAARSGLDIDLRQAFNGDAGSRGSVGRLGVTAACVGPVCAGGASEEGIAEPLAPAIGRLGLLVRALGEHMATRRTAYDVEGHDLMVQGSAVLVDGTRADLAQRERALLELLLVRPGAVIPQSTLLTKVWGAAATDRHVVTVTIARLRRRLGPCGSAIETRQGRGYSFNATPVAVLPGA